MIDFIIPSYSQWVIAVLFYQLRNLAKKRKETDADFEKKRMTLKLQEEDRDFNKENDRSRFPSLPIQKDPYYDNM